MRHWHEHWIDWGEVEIVATATLAIAGLVGFCVWGSMESYHGDPDGTVPVYEITMADGKTYEVICYTEDNVRSMEDVNKMKILNPDNTTSWIKYRQVNVQTVKPL